MLHKYSCSLLNFKRILIKINCIFLKKIIWTSETPVPYFQYMFLFKYVFCFQVTRSIIAHYILYFTLLFFNWIYWGGIGSQNHTGFKCTTQQNIIGTLHCVPITPREAFVSPFSSFAHLHLPPLPPAIIPLLPVSMCLYIPYIIHAIYKYIYTCHLYLYMMHIVWYIYKYIS